MKETTTLFYQKYKEAKKKIHTNKEYAILMLKQVLEKYFKPE